MKSVNFYEATNKIAENQDQFNTIISQFQPNDQSVNMCFELDEEEIKEIQRTKRIWYKQVIGNDRMSPMRISAYKGEIVLDPLNNLNLNSKEGKMLFQSLVILTGEKYTDKTPQEVMEILLEGYKESQK